MDPEAGEADLGDPAYVGTASVGEEGWGDAEFLVLVVKRDGVLGGAGAGAGGRFLDAAFFL
jgi:hypothetical protein